MKTFSSREAQASFGAMLDAARREPVTLTHYGKEVAMVVPMEIGREAVRLYQAGRFSELLRNMPAPRSDAPELSLEDVNRLVHELRP